MSVIERLRHWAGAVKQDTLTLWYAGKHPQTPLAAKLLAGCLVAYAFSPIDLIPDFVPVLGYLDDIILLPLGVWLVLKLVPDEVIAECRRRAEHHLAAGSARPVSHAGLAVIVLFWLLGAGAVLWAVLR